MLLFLAAAVEGSQWHVIVYLQVYIMMMERGSLSNELWEVDENVWNGAAVGGFKFSTNFAEIESLLVCEAAYCRVIGDN